MEYKALYGEFPFLKEVGRERQEQFAEYFKSAPLWLMKELQMEELKKVIEEYRSGRIFEIDGKISIADVAQKLEGIFGAAQKAVDQYLGEIHRADQADGPDSLGGTCRNE